MLKKRVLHLAMVSLLFVLGGNLFATAGDKPVFYKLTDLDKWIVNNRKAEIVTYKGKEALRLNEAVGTGTAYLKDAEFENGIIELDIAAIPRFTGLVFRVKDKDTYESIYFRPQNSRDPAKRENVVQYVSHPEYPWHVLRKNYPGKYEAALDIPLNEWFHVKVVVSDLEAQVFVNDAKTPCLIVKDLKHGISKGSVGVLVGNTSGGTFANFSVTDFSENGNGLTYTPEQEYLFGIFKKRRSVRKFKSTPVPKEHILKILDTARSAPTSGNQQPWKFLVVQERAKLDKMKAACIERSLKRLQIAGNLSEEQFKRRKERIVKYFENTFSAPVYIVVLVDKQSKYPSYNRYDGPLAAGYLMIAARALGYGTVFFTDSIPDEVTKEILNIPERYERVCITPLGVPEEWPQTPEKKPLEEFIVFEKFI